MPAHKRVVFAFFGRGEGLQSAQLAIGAETLAPSSQYLVSVGLVSHIPYDSVFRCVIYIVQGYRQFYHTKARRQMTWVDRQFLDNILTQFLTELWQLVDSQFSEVFRVFDIL